MTERELDQIESDLGVKLPVQFRTFMRKHGDELDKARKAMRHEVVLMTSAAEIIKLNKSLRKHGIEIGDDSTPAPWPAEYLAVSDNGAGDYKCIRLDESEAAIHQFEGEAGRFEHFRSLGQYLADLRKRVARSSKSPARRSDKELLDRAPAFYRDSKGMLIRVQDIEPPLTADTLRRAGIDLDRAVTGLTKALHAVTGIPPGSWLVELGEGDSPAQVRLRYSTSESSQAGIELSGCQIFEGALRLSLRVPEQTTAFDSTIVDWNEFHEGVRVLHEAFMRTALQMTPSALKTGQPTSARYVGIECKYIIGHA